MLILLHVTLVRNKFLVYELTLYHLLWRLLHIELFLCLCFHSVNLVVLNPKFHQHLFLTGDVEHFSQCVSNR